MNQTKTIREIELLRREKNAIILAHNYQLPEIQDIADFTGDSLELARKAAAIENPVIVFSGVYFMAETAAILNPGKTVLIPDREAGCPLADFATAAQVREWRYRYQGYTFVSYINSSAEVKAEVDICCTSSNAVKIVNSLDNDKIVFLPDCNLGAYVQKQVDKEIVLWPGYCVVHHTADLEAIIRTKNEHPGALVLVHPECPEAILETADVICSTGQMFGAVENHPKTKTFIIVTEWGMVHALAKRFPNREFIEPSRRLHCVNMKKNTLEKILHVLRTGENRVTVEKGIADKARVSIERMLEQS